MAFIVDMDMVDTIDTVTILLDQDMEGTWISTVKTLEDTMVFIVAMEDMEGMEDTVHTEMAVFTIG